MRTYTVAYFNGNPKGKGNLSFSLLENGVVIGKCTRKMHVNCNPSFSVKFLTTQSKNRFDDYCDSLTMGEVIEILVDNYNGR